jgi:predicted transglutaminase-like cysteine proteinase
VRAHKLKAYIVRFTLAVALGTALYAAPLMARDISASSVQTAAAKETPSSFHARTPPAQTAPMSVVPQASYAGVAAAVVAPAGWVDFCARYNGECQDGDMPARDIHLTLSSWRELGDVNLMVNQAIEPVSDMEHWGVIDQWDLPYDGKGDCEDYVLLKRKILIEKGYPRQALLVTVVRDEHGDGHAVLTAKTDRGEFLLDNMINDIRAWDETAYVFVKRQSQTNENVWQQIGPPAEGPAMVER